VAFLAFIITIEARTGISAQIESDLVGLVQSMADFIEERIQSDMRVVKQSRAMPTS
jgi:hypothetical protein